MECEFLLILGGINRFPTASRLQPRLSRTPIFPDKSTNWCLRHRGIEDQEVRNGSAN